MIGIGALIANTELDHNFSRWYQSIRTTKLNKFSDDIKFFGDGTETIPILFGSMFVGYGAMYYGIDSDCYLYNWSTKSIRTMVVGVPILLASQRITEGEHTNGVSGRAFMGAIPFITAAQIVNNPISKTLFYVGSTLTAWSTINDNDRYLSQAFLGWSLAYVSSLVVFDKNSPIQFGPLIDKKRYGVTISINF